MGDLSGQNIPHFSTQESKPYRKRTIDTALDSTSSTEHKTTTEKKPKVEIEDETQANPLPRVKIESNDSLQDERHLEDIEEHPPIELTIEQQAVIDLALGGANIFLTGSAGSGKTFTLWEMIRRLKDLHRLTPIQLKYGSSQTTTNDHATVQVVAPTGIAALPLDGKTTYSFAGWNPDSFQKPMETLLKNVKKTNYEGGGKTEGADY